MRYPKQPRPPLTPKQEADRRTLYIVLAILAVPLIPFLIVFALIVLGAVADKLDTRTPMERQYDRDFPGLRSR